MNGLHFSAKRILSFVLVLMMLFASVPVSSLGFTVKPIKDGNDTGLEYSISAQGRTFQITINSGAELYFQGKTLTELAVSSTEYTKVIEAFLDFGDEEATAAFTSLFSGTDSLSKLSVNISGMDDEEKTTIVSFRANYTEAADKFDGTKDDKAVVPFKLKTNSLQYGDGTAVNISTIKQGTATYDHTDVWRLVVSPPNGSHHGYAYSSPSTTILNVSLYNSAAGDTFTVSDAFGELSYAEGESSEDGVKQYTVSAYIGSNLTVSFVAGNNRFIKSVNGQEDGYEHENTAEYKIYGFDTNIEQPVTCEFRQANTYTATITHGEHGEAGWYGEEPVLTEGAACVLGFTVTPEEGYKPVISINGENVECVLVEGDDGSYYTYTVDKVLGDIAVEVDFIEIEYATITIEPYEHGKVYINGELVPDSGEVYKFEKGTELVTITAEADEHYVVDFEIPDPFLPEEDITITPKFVGEPCEVTVIAVPDDLPSNIVTIDGYNGVDGVYSIPYGTRIYFTITVLSGWSLSKAVLITEDEEIALERDDGKYYADITGPASFRFEYQELPTAMVEWNDNTLFIDLSEDIKTGNGMLSTLKGPQKSAAIKALLQQIITINTNGIELNYQQVTVSLEEYNEDGWAYRIKAAFNRNSFTGDADKVWFTVSFADQGVVDSDDNIFTLNDDPCELQAVIDGQSVVIGERMVTIDVEYDSEKVLFEYSLDNGESFTMFRGHILEAAADSNVVFKFVGNLNNAYYVDEFKVNDVEVPLDGCWSGDNKAYMYTITCTAPDYTVEVGAEEMSGVWNYNGHDHLNINTEIAFGITVADNLNTEFTTEWIAENGDHESVIGENKISKTDDTNVQFVDGKIQGSIGFIVGTELPVNSSVRFGLIVTLGGMSHTFYSDYLPVHEAAGNSSMVILSGKHGTNGNDYYYDTVTMKAANGDHIRYSDGLIQHESITYPRDNQTLNEGIFTVRVDVGHYHNWNKNIIVTIYTDTNKPVIESAELVDTDGDGAVDAIQIAAYDTASGIAAIKYSIDNGEAITVDADHFSFVSIDSYKVRHYSATIDLTQTGTYSIWAEDYCYNENDGQALKSKHISEVTQIVIEDMTPPVLDVNVYYEQEGSDNLHVNVENGSIVPAGPVTVVITVADEGFDPAKGKGDYAFMLNGEAVELSFNAAEEGDALVAYYEISQDGEYDLSVTVKDAQGNKATKKYADIDGNEVDMLSFALDTTAPEVLYGIAFEDGISDVVSGRYNDSIIGGEDYYYAVFNQSFRDAIISLKLDDLTGIDLENSYIIVLNSAGKSCLVMLSDDAFIKDIEHGIYDLSFNNLCANGDFDAADTDAWFRISSLYIKDFANHVSEFESEPKFAFDVTAPAVSCTTSPAGELTNADSVAITYYVTDQHFDPAWEGGAFTAAGLPDDAQINWAYDSGLAAWVGVVSVDGEGEYNITASAADVVGNTENSVGLSFEIDRTAPDLYFDISDPTSIKYDEESQTYSLFYGATDEDAEAVGIELTVFVSDENYDEAAFICNITKNGVAYSAGDLTWTTTQDNKHKTTIRLSENGIYSVAFASTDCAGNTAECNAPRSINNYPEYQAITYTIFNGSLPTGVFVAIKNDAGIYERLDPSIADTNYYNQTEPLYIVARVENVSLGVWNPEDDSSYTVDYNYAANGGTSGTKDGDEPEWQQELNNSYVLVYPVNSDTAFDGTYSLTVNITDNRGIKTKASGEFVIDRVAPSDISIHYTENRWLSFLNDVTFGYFFNRNITVSIDANDATSGVSSIAYSVEIEGVAQPVTGSLENGGSFAITQDMLGIISAYAIDNAGNVSDSVTDTGFIIDKVAPGVTVNYRQSINEVGGKKYYNQPVVLTIDVDEANFGFNENLEFGEDENAVGRARVDVSLSKDGHDVTNSIIGTKLSWNYMGDNKWQATVTIPAAENHSDDGEYQFTVTITDVVGNKGEDTSKIIVIDTTAPEFTVMFDNNDYNREVESGYFFDDVRNATITMVERNVKTEDISVITEGTLHDPNDKVEVNVTPWESSGNDEQKCTIAYTHDAKYTLAITGVDLAGNEAVVRYVDKDKNDVPCDQEFYIDVDVINDANVDQRITSRISVSGEDTESWIEKVWTKFLENITFGLYSNKTVKVSLQGTDDFSGVHYIEYTTSNMVLDRTSLENNQVWTRMDGGVYNCDIKADFNLNPVESDRRIIVYMRAVDMAGNITYAASNGMVIEDTNPIAPEIVISAPEAPAHGIYNRNVTLSVSVVDPENEANGVVSSGLASVTYDIFVDGATTARTSGTLYPQGNTDYTRTYNGTITVDASVHNSNDVRVVVHASDHAGNSADADYTLSIDVTAPTISVTFNEGTNSEGFINKDRVATITITERNFNPADVVIRPVGQSNSLPAVSAWTHSGSGDSATHSATLRFDHDGVYQFSVDYTDLAGNPAVGFTSEKFTVDKTNPVIEVVYDDSGVINGRYFSAKRTATVTITETNFNPANVKYTRSASLLGESIELPGISEWQTKNGNEHTCTIVYDSDGDYTFGVSCTDRAGNSTTWETATAYDKEFTVDLTAPVLRVIGIDDKSANNADVIGFELYIEDNNLDIEACVLTLVADEYVDGQFVQNEHELKLADDENNSDIYKHFTSGNLADDGMYYLHCEIVDKAGNIAEVVNVGKDESAVEKNTKTIYENNSFSDSAVFSVNRFGSTYTVDDATRALLNEYNSNINRIVIVETNVDEISDTDLRAARSGLSANQLDYDIEDISGEHEWHQYRYTVPGTNFELDGWYQVFVSSTDATGTESTNEIKKFAIEFGVDKTAPECYIIGVEDGETYPVDEQEVKLNINDLSVAKVEVMLDGELLKSWDGYSDDYSFTIPGDSTSDHKLVVRVVDNAGNETVKEVSKFYVTTNLWVRYYTNTPLFASTVSGAGLGLGALIFFIVRKRRKDDKKSSTSGKTAKLAN